MSNTATALLVKFLITVVLAGIAFAIINRNPWGWILLVAILATAINYLIGDLLVLPATSNIIASIADGVMGALLAYIVDLMTPKFNTTATSLIAFGVLVAVGEYFFHQYLVTKEDVEPKM
ncbi:MAG: DUF2512 family protein [Acidobacteriota bacterium]